VGQQPVESVDDWRQSKHPQHAAERSGELDLSKEQHAPTPVARDWRTIAEHEPPTFTAPFLWHRCKEAARLLIPERKQCQFRASVEPGDDPRRPTTKPSATGIEQNRAGEVMGGRYDRVHIVRSSQEKHAGRALM
jgi:hypothetical protein